MRYFCYSEFDESEAREVILSEKEILEEYWDYWYDRMCQKFGKPFVDANYGKEDCLKDWMVVSWAWEVDEPSEK